MEESRGGCEASCRAGLTAASASCVRQCQEYEGKSVSLPAMLARCARCGTPAATFMSFDYAERAVWLEDLSSSSGEPGHPLCVDHADRLTPPMGWSLTDRRTVTPLFAFDVA